MDMRKCVYVIFLAVGTLMVSCASPPVSSTPTVSPSRSAPTGEVVITRTPFPAEGMRDIPAEGMRDLPADSVRDLPAEGVRDLPTETVAPGVTPAAETMTPQATPTTGTSDIASSCGLSSVFVPTIAPDPGHNALDKTTGLHVTGHAVTVDVASYRLRVTGLVDHPLSLSYDDLRCMPKVTANLTLTCPYFFEDTATWSGVPLKYVLELAGVKSGAKGITMVAADEYESQVELQTALQDENFLAYEWNAQPLPILHGFPLRAVIPSMPGAKWVKWLMEIKVE